MMKPSSFTATSPPAEATPPPRARRRVASAAKLRLLKAAKAYA